VIDDMPPRSGVLCAGTAVVDYIKVIDAYPEIDRLAWIEEVVLSTGGAALNLSADLRCLGATFPVGVIAAIGDDERGAYILGECERLGIDTSRIRVVADAATSFTDAMVERVGGRRTFFHHVGASAVFDAAEADLESAHARILHAGILGVHPLMDELLPDGGNRWVALLERAHAAGMHANLELATLEPELIRRVALPCLPHADSVIVNELEAGALTGITASAPGVDAPVDWPALEAMAVGLVELGVRSLAVVHFPAGAVAAGSDGVVRRQGSVRVPRELARSTTGAGDAMAAGVLYGLHEGWPVGDCLRLGVASAASCVQSPYTSAGIRSAADCLADADRLGHRST
jgi:sugar/nucleoside kinase (ribokinase family)